MPRPALALLVISVGPVPADSNIPISTTRLTKSYGDFTALDQLSLEVQNQEILGLLGPNAAGKSTFIRLLLGAIRPSSGEATIYGLDCYQAREAVHRRVSYLPGDARLYRRMKGREVLDFFSRLRGQKKSQHSIQLAERLELDLSRRVAAMSTGMRQKLAIVTTLAANTSIVILDEPTANLDPTVRSEVLQIVREARDSGATVLFSSHVLSEIEELCDRVIILRKGKKVFHQELGKIREHHRLLGRSTNSLPPLPSELEAETVFKSFPDGTVSFETEEHLGPLLRWISSLDLQDIRVESTGLSRIYAQWDGSQDRTTTALQSEAVKSEDRS